MIDQDLLTRESAAVHAAGLRILQGVRLGPNDAAHVAALLRFMAPKPHTTWVDVGCGFGEVARLMQLERPDLNFILVNNNQYQLDQAPVAFPRWLADMVELPVPDASVDGAMFLYSLCHADAFTSVLAEAARVVKPEGTLFVYDYERLKGDNTLMRNTLCARAISREGMGRITERAGWEITRWDHPDGDDQVWRDLYGPTNQASYELIFKDLVPVLWKARRV